MSKAWIDSVAYQYWRRRRSRRECAESAAVGKVAITTTSERLFLRQPLADGLSEEAVEFAAGGIEGALLVFPAVVN
jgi:hypothetical protein